MIILVYNSPKMMLRCIEERGTVRRTHKQGGRPSPIEDQPSTGEADVVDVDALAAVDVCSAERMQATQSPVSPVRVGTWMCFVFSVDRILTHIPRNSYVGTWCRCAHAKTYYNIAIAKHRRGRLDGQ